MSRDKRLRNKPNKHENCVTDEKSSSRERAIKLAKEHSDWEKKQEFKVLRPDRKTVVYQPVRKYERTNNQEIHKGRI